jgi:uncharacterized membrane protein
VDFAGIDQFSTRRAGRMNPPPRRLSTDALTFALFVAIYLPLHFIIPLPQIIPGDSGATAGLVFLVGVYWTIDLLSLHPGGISRWVGLSKWFIVTVAIGLITLAPTGMLILVRHQSQPYLYAHDGLVQNEVAVRMVLAGRNPYVETYYDTAVAQVPLNIPGVTVNPALDHYAYLPLTFLLPLPFQALFENAGGWFDQRMLHLILLLIMLVVAATLAQRLPDRLTLLIILGLNPLFVGPFIEGRNDILVLFWLVLTVAGLQRGKLNQAAVTLALACATKHPAWVFVPFYFVYASDHGNLRQRFARIKIPLIIFCSLAGILILPWLLWNPPAFIDDVLNYLTGSSINSYPISGIGFGTWLVSVGFLSSTTAQFPFWIFQLAIGLPLLLIVLQRQWTEKNLNTAVAGYGLILFVLQFFSRLFNDNYLGFIIAIMAIGLLMHSPDPEPAASSQINSAHS